MVPTPILVVGANGTVGSQLVPLLLQRGHLVHAATRGGPDATVANGLKTVRLDLRDPATFAAALADVAVAYLVVPGGSPDAAEMLGPFAAAAAKRRVKLVLQSAQGVEHGPDGAPMRRLERQLEGAGVPFVLLRCGWFMDNFHTLWRQDLQGHGSLALPAAEATCAFVAAGDIARAAAVVLTETGWDGRAVTLTGGEALTFAAAVGELSRAAGRPLSYRAVDGPSFARALDAAGVPAAYARLLADLFAQVRAGGASAVSDGVEKITGVVPQRLADYADLHAKMWKKT